MKKRQGFTLIELLAVIVILAIIALIAVPVVMNIINRAQKSAFKDSAYGIVKAGELYYTNQLLEPTGITEDKTFTFPNDNVGLEIKGSKPTGGSMTVTKDGKVEMAITNGRYCVTKGLDDDDVTITEDLANCRLPKKLSEIATTSNIVTEVHECATSGICEVGTKFVINVNDSETQNFYVINDNGTEVTLLMDSILSVYMDQIPGQEEGVGGYRDISTPWMSNEDYGCDGNECANNDKGPITALNKLKEATSTWTNISERSYTIKDDNETPLYSDIQIKTRARLLSYTEASNVCGGSCENSVSSILADAFNGYTTSDYWLSTALPQNGAYTIIYIGKPIYGTMLSNSLVYHNTGIKPVITISK